MISRLAAAFVSLSFILTLCSPSVSAARFPAQRRVVGAPPREVHLARRSETPSLLPRGPQTGIPMVNVGNSLYLANITLGGKGFQVIMDTGSSDLWISGTVPKTVDTGISSSLQYAVGNAAGNINTVDAQFAGYNISQQAYLLVKDASTFASFAGNNISGLAGLGPGFSSVIASQMTLPAGSAVLDRIFQQNTTTGNFISFLLGRANDPTDTIVGEFTVSEVVPGYENITSQSKLSIVELKDDLKINQHWATMVDASGIIGPDGNHITSKSIVKNTPSGKLVAVLDSGFTFSQVPRAVSDAIYGRVQGANYSVEQNLWTIPCGQQLNLTFILGGVEFPVHPMDVSSNDFNSIDADGNTVCLGTFQPITTAFSITGDFDLILGESFLRNAYTLLDFGDFVQNAVNNTADPYIQLLPTTTYDSGHADFVKARLHGVDTTNAPQFSLLPADQGKKSAVPIHERVQHVEQKLIRYRPVIIVCSLIGAGLICAIVVFGYFKRRRQTQARVKRITMLRTDGGFGDAGQNYQKGSYAEINRSEASMYMHPMGGTQQGQAVDPFGNSR